MKMGAQLRIHLRQQLANSSHLYFERSFLPGGKEGGWENMLAQQFYGIHN